ncbi:MAG: hypothetical protein KBT19_09550 [Lachnospiraceae bacterium]|nr:hypothetical protein [Candidatus Colinaster equi]
MVRKIRLSTLIQIIICVCMALLYLCIWPTGLIHRTADNATSELAQVLDADAIKDMTLVSQPFVTDGTRLQYIDVMVTDATPGAMYEFSMYDDKSRRICHVMRTIPSDIQMPGYLHIPTGVNVTRGGFYTYEIHGGTQSHDDDGLYVEYDDSALTVGYEEHMNTSNPNCFALVYDGEELAEYNTYAKYHYAIVFNTWQNVVILLVLAALAVCGCIFTRRFSAKCEEHESTIDVLRVERYVFTPILAIASAILIWMIAIGRVFGTDVGEIVFECIGIMLLLIYLLYVLWGPASGIGQVWSEERLKDNLGTFLQGVCYAGALWQCYEYWNGLYDIFHEYAMRKMLCWFLLSILVTFSKKELLTIINAIYLVASLVFASFYSKPYIGVQDEELIYKLNGQIIVLGGLALICIIRALIAAIKARCINRIRLPYIICTALLFVGMSVFRNGYVWVTVTWVMLAIMLLRMLTYDKVDKLAQALCYGVVMNYAFTVLYCLLHRPFRAYYYYRYGMLYHTVTVTAEYLTLVIAVGLVLFIKKFYSVSEQKGLLSYSGAMWKEILLLGSALTYMIFTLSRTGFVAIIALVLVILLIYVYGIRGGMKSIVDAVKMGMLALASCILLFAGVFTLTRVMPAIVNDPISSDIELDGWQVEDGTSADDERYMTLDRFIYCAKEKLLGISDEAGTEEVESAEVSPMNGVRAKSVGVGNDMLLLSAADDEADVEAATNDINQFSNGRIDLFKRYISYWNLTGHDEMGVPMADGELSIHAHNSFLQAIHDFGLIAGGYVVIFGVITVFVGINVWRKEMDNVEKISLLVTVAVVIGFAAAGMTEWMFHICNPFGWMLFMSVMPLMVTNGRRNSVEK